jgi:hypothetical protein
MSVRGAVSLHPDKIRSAYQKIKTAFVAEFPSERLYFQEPDDVVSTCNGAVMTLDVWPIIELTTSKNETIRRSLSGLGGSIDIWPSSHPSRGAIIRVSWNAEVGKDFDSDDGSQGLMRYTLAMVVLFAIFVVVWVRLVPAAWKVSTLDSVLPGSSERILRTLGWLGSIVSRRNVN